MTNSVAQSSKLNPKVVDLGAKGATAFVSAAGLKTDLSELNLVEDEHFQHLVEVLRAHVRDMNRSASELFGEL